MGFSTLVRICNLRYFFALDSIAKVARASKIGPDQQKPLDFSLGKLGFGLDGDPE